MRIRVRGMVCGFIEPKTVEKVEEMIGLCG